MEQTHLSSRLIEKDIFLKATPERVFQALTEKASMERWFVAKAEGDLSLGGAFRLDWWPGVFTLGKILTLAPPHSLSYTWEAILPGDTTVTEALSPGDTTITFDLVAENDGTRLHLIHAGIGSDEEWDHYYTTRNGGWNIHLEHLTAWLEMGKETSW